MDYKETDLNYQKICEILQQNKKGGTTQLPGHFYEKARRYLESLRDSYKMEPDSFSPKARSISENLRRVAEDIEEIYDLREKKVINAAIIKAHGREPDFVKSFTQEEKELFNEIVKILEKWRRETFERKEAKVKKEKTKEKEEIKEKKREAEVANRDAMTLMILEDLPPFVSEDRKSHTLKKGDIITLSKKTADILVKNGKARSV